MPKRHQTEKEYVKKNELIKPVVTPSLAQVALKVPGIITHFDTSIIKQHQKKVDWNLYRIELRDGIPFVVREMCDRCGKVYIHPGWRKIRDFNDKELGHIYFETGICKSCINASVYSDKFLDGDPLTELESRHLYDEYARQYEKAWRLVIASATNVAMTEDEWEHRCAFFQGCAFCGATVEVRAKYFPIYLNGSYTSWNIIPLCSRCFASHYAGRNAKGKEVKRYKIFSTSYSSFNRQKTTRMYLLRQMEKHGLYVEPLKPFRVRFYETKILEGAD